MSIKQRMVMKAQSCHSIHSVEFFMSLPLDTFLAWIHPRDREDYQRELRTAREEGTMGYDELRSRMVKK